MDTINLHIYSEQHFNAEHDIIVQDHIAKIKRTPQSIFITYLDDGVQTMYKISPHRFFIRRSGPTEQMQEFIQGKTCNGNYHNSGLNLNITTTTHNLTIQDNEQGLTIYLEYLLHINDILQGLTKITITATERIEH